MAILIITIALAFITLLIGYLSSWNIHLSMTDNKFWYRASFKDFINVYNRVTKIVKVEASDVYKYSIISKNHEVYIHADLICFYDHYMKLDFISWIYFLFWRRQECNRLNTENNRSHDFDWNTLIK